MVDSNVALYLVEYVDVNDGCDGLHEWSYLVEGGYIVSVYADEEHEAEALVCDWLDREGFAPTVGWEFHTVL